MKAFQIPKIELYWKTISYVQTCIKAKRGFGKEIVVEFYAPLDLNKPASDIKYEFRRIGEDLDLI
jgi:hypothetical protein